MKADPPAPIVLRYPFTGRWRACNSPARRVPSHGTHRFGTTYAIDFIAVDERGRSAPPSLRAVLAPEPPEVFVGFGRPILAPVTGRVVGVHDGVADHEARRSQLTLLPYMFTQARRARAGGAGLAGNHVVIAPAGGSLRGGPFVAVAHLQRGSVCVSLGQEVEAGEPVGACGNSGNSTEPHVHVQVTDSMDWSRANGLPMAFGTSPEDARLPAESEIVEVP